MATATKAKATTTGADLDMTDIGSAAGVVWRYLEANGPGAVETVKRKIKLSSDVFYAAVGWLAREGKLEVEGEGKKVQISIR